MSARIVAQLTLLALTVQAYFNLDFLSWLTFPLILFLLADIMKSMLQELDSNLLSKDDFIHQQNSKLSEMDKIIQVNKAEIERLEKRNKMQDHKVRNQNTQTSFTVLGGGSCSSEF